jgi:prepilin-type N-terminal cleavage/methylation domain-containing protein/prepilin-type processing-associated H-X9-DG protein
MKRRRGFTLIELLVVIAIIAILAAILFPVFAQARAKARAGACLSNVRQIGTGIAMYVQDYDERFPPPYTYSAQEPPGGGWYQDKNGWTWFAPQIVYPYTKNYRIYTCPDGVSQAVNTPFQGHYGINESIVSRLESGMPPPSTLSQITAPANTYLFMDSGSYVIRPAQAALPQRAWWYLPGACKVLNIDPAKTPSGALTNAFQPDCLNARHSGGMNMAFCDGHAKWLRVEVPVAEAQKGAPAPQGAWNPANP